MNFKRELTPEELAKPYAKYYFREPAKVDPELLYLIDHPMDPRYATYPQDIPRLFLEEIDDRDRGWCIMPEGNGYVADRIFMPGVTPEMITWWFAWHPLESLRYMIWYPERHFYAGVSEEHRKKLLDPAVPINEKVCDVDHFIREDSRDRDDLTEIPPQFTISFHRPEEMGLSLDMLGYPEKGTMVCAGPRLNPDGSLPARVRIMLHFAKAVPGGVNFYSRFWMSGYTMMDGGPKWVGLFEGAPKDNPVGLWKHSIQEYSNLAGFLPELYKEMKGKIEL